MTSNTLHREARIRLFTIGNSKVLGTTQRTFTGEKVNEMWYFNAMKPIHSENK